MWSSNVTRFIRSGQPPVQFGSLSSVADLLASLARYSNQAQASLFEERSLNEESFEEKDGLGLGSREAGIITANDSQLTTG
jgi:hypothetical protein